LWLRCRQKNYRLASTSRKIAMKFLKEIKVIFFVESSKKGCGTKIGHLSGLKSSDTWLTTEDAPRSTPCQSPVGIQRHDTLRSWYLECYRLSKLNIALLPWFTGAYWWKRRRNIHVSGYLVERRCPPGVQDYRLMLWFNQDFRALLLGFNKKPETVKPGFRTSFPLFNLLFSENLVFYWVGKKTLEKVRLIKNSKQVEFRGFFAARLDLPK